MESVNDRIYSQIWGKTHPLIWGKIRSRTRNSIEKHVHDFLREQLRGCFWRGEGDIRFRVWNQAAEEHDEGRIVVGTQAKEDNDERRAE
jgi:hypothetical protein